MRIGIGYDIHKLTQGRPMILGGVRMNSPKGPEGHSDGDTLLHAICDAVLGALGKPDIGEKFPDTAREYKDVSSIELLRNVAGLMEKKNYKVSNLDCVVIIEEPKIASYREKILKTIADIFKISVDKVNVKGKTNEGLGVIGAGDAVAAYATVLLEKKDTPTTDYQ